MNKVVELVSEVLDSDKSGHGMDHVLRVYDLAMKFSDSICCDKEVVALIALLHDVDDYKLVGKEEATKLSNARRILKELKIDSTKTFLVLDAINKLGYSKSLQGIRPTSIEGMIVSDADMCDALGANGILRSYAYSLSKNRPFFEKDNFPIKDISYQEYTTVDGTAINHMFDKILKLKDMMLTEAGKKEAIRRHKFVVSFLEEFFIEENEEAWLSYLRGYLENGKN